MPSRAEHINAGGDLEYIPNYLFGTNEIPADIIKNVQNWMDYPVHPVEKGGMLGWIIQEGPHKGEFITPNTHRELHHNPFDVVRVFGGGHGDNEKAFNAALIHDQQDFSQLDRWLIASGYPGSAQFASAGVLMGLWKGVSSGIDNFTKFKKGELSYEQALVNTAKSSGIGTLEGVAKLAVGASVHNAVLLTSSEVLKNISASGGALVAGFTIYEIGADVTRLLKGEITGKDLAKNALQNTTKATVSLYSAKIGALIGATGGPLGVALGGLIGGVVGGVITEQVILQIIRDLNIKPEDFIKPLTTSEINIVNTIAYNIYSVDNLSVYTNKFINEFIWLEKYENILKKIIESKMVELGKSKLK